MHILLTDYECIYYEIADLMKKFSSLNAKLGGTERTLLEKVRNMFLSSTTKVSNENKNDNTLEFDLEVTVGKRILKWHFFGQHLNSMNYVIFLFFSVSTRIDLKFVIYEKFPLIKMSSTTKLECRISSKSIYIFFRLIIPAIICCLKVIIRIMKETSPIFSSIFA